MSEATPFTIGQSVTWLSNQKQTIRTGTIYRIAEDGLIWIHVIRDGLRADYGIQCDRLERDIKRAQKTAKQLAKQYTVYALLDPRNEQVHYVGISLNMQSRFTQHLQCEGLNLEKNLWIQELHRLNLQPTLLILETVNGSQQAHAREAYWIQHYLNQHAPLKNIDKVDGSKDKKAIRNIVEDEEL